MITCFSRCSDIPDIILSVLSETSGHYWSYWHCWGLRDSGPRLLRPLLLVWTETSGHCWGYWDHWDLWIHSGQSFLQPPLCLTETSGQCWDHWDHWDLWTLDICTETLASCLNWDLWTLLRQLRPLRPLDSTPSFLLEPLDTVETTVTIETSGQSERSVVPIPTLTFISYFSKLLHVKTSQTKNREIHVLVYDSAILLTNHDLRFWTMCGTIVSRTIIQTFLPRKVDVSIQSLDSPSFQLASIFLLPNWLSVSWSRWHHGSNDHEWGLKGLTLFSKCSLSRRNMICAAMVESIVLDCLLITRPKRDHTRSEGAEVIGMERKRRARRAKRGNSGSSTFHWTSGCDCGAYHGRKGASGLNQCASSHCTSRSSLASFFSSTCMAPSMSIAWAAAALLQQEADCHRHVFFSYAAALRLASQEVDDCTHRVRVLMLEEGEVLPQQQQQIVDLAASILLFLVAVPPTSWEPLPWRGTKTGSRQLFGKNCGTYRRKRSFTLFHWSSVSFTVRCTRHLKAKKPEREWITT